MSNLLDLSGKIDPASLALFETLGDTAGSLGAPFFVVGATARDMIFKSDAGNRDRLFEDHMDLVEIQGFDYVRAGARLLGRDVANIGKPETTGRIREILAKETAEEGQYRLIQAMMTDRGVSDEESENRFDKLLTLLRQLVKGIEDR